jgi:biotin carboxyl carrier protein
VGDRVEPGQRLGVLEAMKMEHNLTTPVAGEVMEVGCKTGEQVSAKVLLFRIEPDDAE